MRTPGSTMRVRGDYACRQPREQSIRPQSVLHSLPALPSTRLPLSPKAPCACWGTSGWGTFSHTQHWAAPSLTASCHHLSKLFVIPILQMRILRPKETEAEVHRGRKTWASGSCAPGGGNWLPGGGDSGMHHGRRDKQISRSSKLSPDIGWFCRLPPASAPTHAQSMRPLQAPPWAL